MPDAQSRPFSAAELCDALRRARPFERARLDRVLRVDEDRGLVEVQAGATWRSLAARLRPDDPRAHAARTTVPTIGESIARNAAGPDGRPAVIHVESLALAMPDGELRRASRALNADLFALCVGGQGLFGVPYSVTLRIESMARAIAEVAPEAAPPAALPGQCLRLLVPPERLERFTAAAHAACEAWRVQPLEVQTRRTLPEEETFLRWARRDYVEVALGLPDPADLGQSLRLQQLRQDLIDAAIAAGGGFQIASTPEATRAQTEACYPEIKRFLAEKRRFDRDDRLANEWYRRQRALFSG
jgi:hypothetical protein